MAYSKFGEFLRQQRIRHHEVMGDTAKMLGVSVPFLSAVESGKKNVPKAWINKLIEHYQLNSDQQVDLNHAIEESKTQLKLNLVSSTDSQKQAAFTFARSFDNIDEETAARIIKLLEGKSDNSGLSD